MKNLYIFCFLSLLSTSTFAQFDSQLLFHWDDSTKSFKENAANDLSKLNYSANWKLPKV